MTNPNPIEPPPPSKTGLRCRVKVGSAAGILAVVPHLLGFRPTDSLVLLGIGGPHSRVRLAFRYDLPDPPDEDLAGDIAAHAVSVLDRQHLSMAIAIGYGDGPAVTPVMDILGSVLRDAGITIHDMLRVQGGRYWSYVCGDPNCCSPDGVPFDTAAHPASEALATAGLTVLGDRSELVSTLATDAAGARAMRGAVTRARRRAGQLASRERAASGGSALHAVADAGRRSVRQAVALYRRGERLTDHDEIAWLGVTLGDLRVRDDAWARMDPEFHEEHRRLWTDLVRLLPPEHVAPPAALLAFTAWQAGDGALASIAIERALDADPRYSMALLLAEALHAGLPPSAARVPMTPKQVAASYARQRRQAGGRQSSEGERPACGGSADRDDPVRAGGSALAADAGGSALAADAGPRGEPAKDVGPARGRPARGGGPAAGSAARSGPAGSGPGRRVLGRRVPGRGGPRGGGPGALVPARKGTRPRQIKR